MSFYTWWFSWKHNDAKNSTCRFRGRWRFFAVRFFIFLGKNVWNKDSRWTFFHEKSCPTERHSDVQNRVHSVWGLAVNDFLKDKKKSEQSELCSDMAPPTGLEPVTSWLTVMRSTDWAMEEYNKIWRRRSIFPGRRQPSIVDTGELNFCVRDGNRWILTAKIGRASCRERVLLPV